MAPRRVLLGLATACALLAGHSVLAGAPARDDYDYDGQTTYCYWLDQGMSVVSLDYSYVKVQAKGLDCPVTITVATASSTPTVIRPNTDVSYQFTATLNLNDNAFGMDALMATIPAPVTLRPVQIGHANVHACSRTTVCDIFRNGDNRQITDQETGNFTDDRAVFNQKLAFNRAGVYNVFAHLVLPPTNPYNESLHFMTFTTATVQSTDSPTGSTTTTDADSGSGSVAIIVSAIVGSVVLLLVVFLAVYFYRRKNRQELAAEMSQYPTSTPGFQSAYTTKSKSSRLDWNAEPSASLGPDHYEASLVSQFRQPPPLTASALTFQDSHSSQGRQKTASSSGDSTGGGSSRRNGGGSSHRSHQHSHSHSHSQSHSHGYRETDNIPSYFKENAHVYDDLGSVGTSSGFPGMAYPDHHQGGNNQYDYDDYQFAYPPPHHGNGHSNGHSSGLDHTGSSGFSGYEVDASAFDRPRGDTYEELSEVSRDSESSVGTVDFTSAHAITPQPRQTDGSTPPPPPISLSSLGVEGEEEDVRELRQQERFPPPGSGGVDRRTTGVSMTATEYIPGTSRTNNFVDVGYELEDAPFAYELDSSRTHEFMDTQRSVDFVADQSARSFDYRASEDGSVSASAFNSSHGSNASTTYPDVEHSEAVFENKKRTESGASSYEF